MGKKKIYRSLFDSDDVFEVEEITDNSDVSSKDITQVKHDETPVDPSKEVLQKEEHTIEDCWDAINKIADAVGCSLTGKKGVKDANEPGVENKVTRQNPTIDEDEVEEGKDSEERKVADEEPEEFDEGASKDVKDSYSRFTKVNDSKKSDTVHATQVAFQERYNREAQKR